MFQIFLVTLLLVSGISAAVLPEVEDVYVPDACNAIAQTSDHVLIEYELKYTNGTVAHSLKKPDQLLHFVVDNSDNMSANLKGMCLNATRKFTWSTSRGLNLFPILPIKTEHSSQDIPLILTVVMSHITTPDDYAIFEALKVNNISHAMNLIDSHHGVNAVDEWGQTPLMISTIEKKYHVVASLLNTRRPTVEVNLAKPSGFTALFYAIEHAPVSIVQALLRRGADPNMAIQAPSALGNTPLHFACLMEKAKHAELLLEYGANPFAVNQYGQTPAQLVPASAAMSTKYYFKKIFEDARAKWLSVSVDGSGEKAPVAFNPEL